MFNYTCLNPIAACGLDRLSADYVKVDDLANADVALVRSAAMHDLDLPENLLAIARAGAGVNNIPLDKCAEQGVVVFNTPGANANGVKELVLCGMLLASRDVIGGIDWVKENKDDEGVAKAAEKAKKAFAGTEILGKKLGVIGCGAIGVLIANAAIELGMEVVGFDAYLTLKNACALNPKVKIANTVEELYKECDFITIHVPANDATKGMISKEAIEMMKDTAVVLNFARDVLVDEDAMVEALAANKIRKYVVDFPTPKTAGKEGCIVIPHLGASTAEAEDNCAMMAVDEIRNYVENGNIINSVNYPMCDFGVCAAASRVAVLAKADDSLVADLTAICNEASVSVTDMITKTRGAVSYTMMDLSAPLDESAIEKMKKIDATFKVRVVK